MARLRRRLFVLAGSIGLVILGVGAVCTLVLLLSAVVSYRAEATAQGRPRLCYAGEIEIGGLRPGPAGPLPIGKTLAAPRPPKLSLSPYASPAFYNATLGQPGDTLFLTLRWRAKGIPCPQPFPGPYPVPYPVPYPPTPNPFAYPAAYPAAYP